MHDDSMQLSDDVFQLSDSTICSQSRPHAVGCDGEPRGSEEALAPPQLAKMNLLNAAVSMLKLQTHRPPFGLLLSYVEAVCNLCNF